MWAIKEIINNHPKVDTMSAALKYVEMNASVILNDDDKVRLSG